MDDTPIHWRKHTQMRKMFRSSNNSTIIAHTHTQTHAKNLLNAPNISGGNNNKKCRRRHASHIHSFILSNVCVCTVCVFVRLFPIHTCDGSIDWDRGTCDASITRNYHHCYVQHFRTNNNFTQISCLISRLVSSFTSRSNFAYKQTTKHRYAEKIQSFLLYLTTCSCFFLRSCLISCLGRVVDVGTTAYDTN